MVPASKGKVVVELQALVWQYCSFHPVTGASLADVDHPTSSSSCPLVAGTVTVTVGFPGGPTFLTLTVTARLAEDDDEQPPRARIVTWYWRESVS